MTTDPARDLASLIRQNDPLQDGGPQGGTARVRQATVTAVALPTCSLVLGTSTVPVPGVKSVNSYTPVAGDTVFVIQNGPDLLILGPYGSPGVPGPTITGNVPNLQGAVIGTGAFGVVQRDNAGGIHTSGEWFRSDAINTGWYSNAGGCGIYMSAADTWVRAYPYPAAGLAAGKIDAAGLINGQTSVQAMNGNLVLTQTTAGNWSLICSTDVAIHFTPTPNASIANNAFSVYRVIRASAFTVSSTQRMKSGIKATKYGLDELLKLKVRDFRYTEMTDTPDRVHTGFIAEDVDQVYPHAVEHGPDGPEGLDYSQFTPLIVAGLQEFVRETRAEIKALTRRVAKLEGAR